MTWHRIKRWLLSIPALVLGCWAIFGAPLIIFRAGATVGERAVGFFVLLSGVSTVIVAFDFMRRK